MTTPINYTTEAGTVVVHTEPENRDFDEDDPPKDAVVKTQPGGVQIELRQYGLVRQHDGRLPGDNAEMPITVFDWHTMDSLRVPTENPDAIRGLGRAIYMSAAELGGETDA